jgi:hypothetical protein
MDLKKQGMEIFTPDPESFLTCTSCGFPKKLLKHFHNGGIQYKYLTGFEFTRLIQKKR